LLWDFVSSGGTVNNLPSRRSPGGWLVDARSDDGPSSSPMPSLWAILGLRRLKPRVRFALVNGDCQPRRSGPKSAIAEVDGMNRLRRGRLITRLHMWRE